MNSRWPDVFSDNESGVKCYQWAIGSKPGHADIMPYTLVTSPEATSDADQPLSMKEGHSYYIAIKVSI